MANKKIEIKYTTHIDGMLVYMTALMSDTRVRKISRRSYSAAISVACRAWVSENPLQIPLKDRFDKQVVKKMKGLRIAMEPNQNPWDILAAAKNEDERIGQFIGNLCGSRSGDGNVVFYMSDKDLIKLAQERIETKTNAKIAKLEAELAALKAEQ